MPEKKPLSYGLLLIVLGTALLFMGLFILVMIIVGVFVVVVGGIMMRKEPSQSKWLLVLGVMLFLYSGFFWAGGFSWLYNTITDDTITISWPYGAMWAFVGAFLVIVGCLGMKGQQKTSTRLQEGPAYARERTESAKTREKEIVREREVIVKIRCAYCNGTFDETLDKCPHCGAKR